MDLKINYWPKDGGDTAHVYEFHASENAADITIQLNQQLESVLEDEGFSNGTIRLFLKGDNGSLVGQTPNGICTKIRKYFSSPIDEDFVGWATSGLDVWFSISLPKQTMAVNQLPGAPAIGAARNSLSGSGREVQGRTSTGNSEKQRKHTAIPKKFKQLKWDLSWAYIRSVDGRFCMPPPLEKPSSVAPEFWEAGFERAVSKFQIACTRSPDAPRMTMHQARTFFRK